MKNHIIWSVLSVLVLSILIGCANTNTAFDDSTNSSIHSQIVEGKTTKNDLRRMFGNPDFDSKDQSEVQVWYYASNLMKKSASSYIPFYGDIEGTSSGDKKSLTIWFNKNGTVKKYEYNSRYVTEKTGSMANVFN